MLHKTSQSFLIHHPKMDGSDHGRFLSDIARATHENIQEGRALERRVFDALEQLARKVLPKLKNLRDSAHRRRWRDLYD